MKLPRTLIVLIVVAGLAVSPVLAQRTLYVSPDVPTDDPGGSGTIFLPWDVIDYKAGVYTPLPVLTLPPNTAVDAAHKMDKPGNWLLSVEAPTQLPPGLGTWFQPEDVFQYDGLDTMFFDGSMSGVPPGVNVDAVYLIGDDFGTLVISFDVPTTIGAIFDPADTVMWAGGVFNTKFDASTSGGGVALSSNVTAADESIGLDVLGMDIPTDLSPWVGLFPPTVVPGRIAQWDGSNYDEFEWLSGWPLSSEVDALSCQGNPGRVYEKTVYQFPILLGKSALVPGAITITWSPSCSSGAEDYGIYEGTIGTWYSHVKKAPVSGTACVDALANLTEDVIPGGSSNYYLVVPHNWAEEGAYGEDFIRTRIPQRMERPTVGPPGIRCTPVHIVTPCP